MESLCSGKADVDGILVGVEFCVLGRGCVYRAFSIYRDFFDFVIDFGKILHTLDSTRRIVAI